MILRRPCPWFKLRSRGLCLSPTRPNVLHRKHSDYPSSAIIRSGFMYYPSAAVRYTAWAAILLRKMSACPFCSSQNRTNFTITCGNITSSILPGSLVSQIVPKAHIRSLVYKEPTLHHVPTRYHRQLRPKVWLHPYSANRSSWNNYQYPFGVTDTWHIARSKKEGHEFAR